MARGRSFGEVIIWKTKQPRQITSEHITALSLEITQWEHSIHAGLRHNISWLMNCRQEQGVAIIPSQLLYGKEDSLYALFSWATCIGLSRLGKGIGQANGVGNHRRSFNRKVPDSDDSEQAPRRATKPFSTSSVGTYSSQHMLRLAKSHSSMGASNI